MHIWCIKIGIVLCLHFNPRVQASADGLQVPEGLSVKDSRLRPKFNHVHYFLIQVDFKIVLIFLWKIRKMSLCLTISKRIVSFGNIYKQLKILVVVISPFVKRAPVAKYLGTYIKYEYELNCQEKLKFHKFIWKQSFICLMHDSIFE
jgi:hypothetical protein